MKPGSSVFMRQSHSSTKSLKGFSVQSDLSGTFDSLRASQSMVPSLTFQWPLSPSGTFQPVRSLPLNSDTNPWGGVVLLSAASKLSPATGSSPAAAKTSQQVRCMDYLPCVEQSAVQSCLRRYNAPGSNATGDRRRC